MEPTEPTQQAPTSPPSMAPPPPVVPPSLAPRGRPPGITVVASLSVICGVLIAIAGLFVLLTGAVIGGIAGANGAGGSGGVFAGIGFLFAVIAGLVAIAYFGAAFGVWRGRPWGWLLAMVVWIVSLAFGVLGVVNGITIVGVIFNIVFPIVSIYFLWQPDVKRALGRS